MFVWCRVLGDELEVELNGQRLSYLHGGPGWALSSAALKVLPTSVTCPHSAACLSLPSPSVHFECRFLRPSLPPLSASCVCVSRQAVLPHLDSYRGLVNAGERVKLGLDLKPLHDNLDDFYFGYMLKRAGVPLKRVRLTTHPPRMDRKKSHSSSL